MTHVDDPTAALERKRARQMDCGLKQSRHKPATAQSCLIQAEYRLDLVCRLWGGQGGAFGARGGVLSSGVACEAAHSDSDRPSVCICPSVAAERLADDDTTSGAADQHFQLPNLTSPELVGRQCQTLYMRCLFLPTISLFRSGELRRGAHLLLIGCCCCCCVLSSTRVCSVLTLISLLCGHC